ncbi:SAM-dependent methyltransferase [Desulforamulus aeronauticus]|uniref:tRNA-Thr(GGU) m(6)t(6)A37 methyltransferase TsaA n=1 Tax=Desulforamulus aeronauticus DSM 10349 TaxID=1121421 RepID=A0A1M6NKM4_9FIRM|nr:SAM-dependent methyltransferase [Desulforamulus aeronauticus]SHJ96243.1 tRNA-Thr(GGU) m(6)t(6)A37 methyltransferase TsaA [Desulforamulus aeronauticus DSM 10349]
MSKFMVHPIGKVHSNENGTFIKVEEKYIPALQALEGFSHINVIWWFSDFDDEQSRSVLQTEQPYKGAPDVMGIFATRSPMRPNPIALTTSEVIHIDNEKGIIQIAFIDSNDNSPVLDIKPYTPSLDRVEKSGVPTWCSHWPKSTEEAASFAWEKEFNF